MDKISRLSREIRQLEKSKKKLEELLKRSEKQQEVDRKEIAKAYEDFYNNKTNTEFVLYDRYPSVEALKLYLQYISDRLPLYGFGKLNVKELAEIVKHIYQFKTGKERDGEILTPSKGGPPRRQCRRAGRIQSPGTPS